MTEFMEKYDIFLAEQNLSPFLEEYQHYLVNIDREVKVIRNGQEMIRTALGINERGELIVRDEQGRTTAIFSGEVSVRGLYGYI